MHCEPQATSDEVRGKGGDMRALVCLCRHGVSVDVKRPAREGLTWPFWMWSTGSGPVAVMDVKFNVTVTASHIISA